MSHLGLTKDAVRHMLADDDRDQLVDPICQVLTVKKIASTSEQSPDRYRVILSDGDYYTQGEWERSKKVCFLF